MSSRLMRVCLAVVSLRMLARTRGGPSGIFRQSLSVAFLVASSGAMSGAAQDNRKVASAATNSSDALITDGAVNHEGNSCTVDLADLAALIAALDGPSQGTTDLKAFAAFQVKFTGAVPVEPDCCDPWLAPLDDQSGLPVGGRSDLIISEIKPGVHIEVFNTTESDIDLSLSPYWWCAPFQYRPVSTAKVVPAGGYATVGWPDFLTNPTEGSGEVILFRTNFFFTSTNILDFVCWGAPRAITRVGQAEEVGKWAGDCAPEIPSGGAIHRRIGTDGTRAGHYDVTSIPSPTDCTP